MWWLDPKYFRIWTPPTVTRMPSLWWRKHLLEMFQRHYIVSCWVYSKGQSVLAWNGTVGAKPEGTCSFGLFLILFLRRPISECLKLGVLELQVYCVKSQKNSINISTGSSIASDISKTFSVQNWNCSLIFGFFNIEVNCLRFYTVWFPV